MQSIAYQDLLDRFQKVQKKTLKFLTQEAIIAELFSEESQEPENFLQNLYDPIDFYIEPKPDTKKKTSTTEVKQQIVLVGKSDQKEKQSPLIGDDKKKVYKAGPFALFYEIDQGKADKDALVWYYKEAKDIVGPVSSYNMDKMVYYKKIDDQTRVAFNGVDKFVKFAKIKKIVETEKPKE